MSIKRYVVRVSNTPYFIKHIDNCGRFYYGPNMHKIWKKKESIEMIINRIRTVNPSLPDNYFNVEEAGPRGNIVKGGRIRK